MSEVVLFTCVLRRVDHVEYKVTGEEVHERWMYVVSYEGRTISGGNFESRNAAIESMMRRIQEAMAG